MGLPAAGVPMKASMINAESAEVTTSNGKLAGTGGGTTPSAGSFVIRFDDATPSPVDQIKPYAYSDFYGKSFTPPTISCGTSTAAIGQGSGKGYFEAELDFSTTTGAIVVYFYPNSIPDGVSFTYNGVTYNTLTSNTNGVITAATGTNNIVGTTGSEATLIAGSPYSLTKSVWNGTSFGSTGNLQTNIVAAASNINLTAGGITYTLVIPKTSASPANGVLKIVGFVSTTGWRVNAPCPITLPSFTTNTVAASKGAACCTATQDQTYYFARNASLNGSASAFIIDTNTLPQVNNFVFSDNTGATALANGFYKISATQAIQVVDGTVLAVSTCATCLTPYNSSANSTSGNVCSATINQTYYHNGSGSTPVANDTVYSNQTPSFLPSGYYKISSSQYIIVGSSGNVTSVNNCVTLTAFLHGNPSAFPADMCNQLSSQGTYYHDGSGTYPVTSDIVYVDSAGNTPLNGGTGMNWPYFPSGPQPPDGWFRITGSTGTVQSQSNCP